MSVLRRESIQRTETVTAHKVRVGTPAVGVAPPAVFLAIAEDPIRERPEGVPSSIPHLPNGYFIKTPEEKCHS